MAKLRSRRPTFDADSFIAGAEVPSTASAGIGEARLTLTESQPTSDEGRGGTFPWAAPGVREDVTKLYNLRLPEPLKLKLDFIRRETRVSVHEFIMGALVPAVEAEIDRLTHRSRR